jgi:hypothetical protein
LLRLCETFLQLQAVNASSSVPLFGFSYLPQVFRTESPPFFSKRTKKHYWVLEEAFVFEKSGLKCIINQVPLPKYPFSAHSIKHLGSFIVAQNSFYSRRFSFPSDNTYGI